MSEDIKEFETVKKEKDKIESKPKKKYKKDKKIENNKRSKKENEGNNKEKEISELVTMPTRHETLSDKRKEFLKKIESRFINKEFVRYKERIFKIQSFKCDVLGNGHIELFNKKFSCTIGLLVENLKENCFEFDL